MSHRHDLPVRVSLQALELGVLRNTRISKKPRGDVLSKPAGAPRV